MDETFLRSYGEVIEFGLRQIEIARNNYTKFTDKAERRGLKTFLLSLVDQKREQAKRFKEIKQSGNFDKIFSNEATLKLEQKKHEIAAAPAGQSNDLELLSVIISSEARASQLYRFLESQSTNSDAALLFRRLADIAGKQQAMAKDQHELAGL